MNVQLQLPILVALSGLPVNTRLDVLEAEMLGRVKSRFGLSRSEIIRRGVRLVRLEMGHRGASADFLMDSRPPSFPRRANKLVSGRKPRARRISDLEKNIAANLRAVEAQRRELAALQAREARAA
jgi:hypothetical protein